MKNRKSLQFKHDFGHFKSAFPLTQWNQIPPGLLKLDPVAQDNPHHPNPGQFDVERLFFLHHITTQMENI